MSDYLSPGVYIQELEGPAPIIGVSTSIAAFIGMAERGPTNIPILCTGPGDYQRWFGGLLYQSDFTVPGDTSGRAHCYLPYAVAGFFNNGGQVLYVERVVPTEATNAAEMLFDRGSATSITTTLMRASAVGDGIGTTPATGQLIVLSPETALPASSIRIDDGSVSEYATIAQSEVMSGVAALNLPLQLAHAEGANFTVYAQAAGTAFTLATDAQPGNTMIFLQGGGLVLNDLIQLSANGVSLIVVIQGFTQTSPAAFAVTLTQPLAMGFSAATGATTVTAFAPVAAPAATLILSASGGDLLLYTDGTVPLTAGDLIDIDFATPNLREVRTIGSLTQLTLGAPTSVDWPVNSLVTPVAAATVSLSGTLPAIGATVLSLVSRAGIYPGSILTLSGGEVVTVTAVPGPRATGLDPGNVTITPALTAAPASAVVTVTSSGTTSFSAAATQGAQVISLNSRVGIYAGSVLQLGVATTQEYVVVLAVQGTRALGLDPGSVVLNAPIVNSYPANVVPVVTYALVPTLGAGEAATQLVLDAPPGSLTALVTWSTWVFPTIVQITLPNGVLAYNQFEAASLTAPSLTGITLTAPLQNPHPAGSTVVQRDPLILIQALDAGAWGNRVAIAVQDESPGLVSSTRVIAVIGTTQLQLSSLTGIEAGTYLEMFSPAGVLVQPYTPLTVSAVNLSTTTITLDNALTAAQLTAIGLATATAPVILRSREFRISVYLYRHPDAAVPSRNTQVIQSEVFGNLSMDSRHSHYFQTVIGSTTGPKRLSDGRPQGASWLIRTQDTATTPAATQLPRLGPEALIDVLPNGLRKPAQHKLQGGDDSMATVDDDMYIGDDDADPVNRTGIYALLNVPQISIVATPGQGTQQIQSALIDHCENALYRFAVLDPEFADSAIADIQAQRQAFDTKFAAIYYPWLTIPDPFPTNLNAISNFPLPPSGHVVGLYAMTDDSRGVFKAPANEVVQGINGLTATLVKGDQDVLNPSPTNINVIRDFTLDGRGIRVWGARVMTSDDNYKYVPVKRLMMFIEQSLDVGLQDVVFEPNAPPLWASVTRLISNFLTTVWAAGGLQGATAAQSFFVRCDLTTMTQDDIDAGRLIAVVGVAPVQPAEFVIIQISLTIPATST